tara:strand:- start:15099 stop:15800 length:702 start_codon:yes stop_codon:yes gene_type:complete
MERLTLKALNKKNKYKGIKLSGSPKVFYGKYPYRIKILGNNIITYFEEDSQNSSYNDTFSKMLDFVWEYPKTVKLLNGWSRYAYFHSKDTFDKFIDNFSDSIEEVTGPLNKTHASHLATVNAENYWDFKQHVIRKDNYFGKWDTKLILRYPVSTYHGTFYGKLHNSSGYKQTMNHFRKVGETVRDCSGDGDVRQHQRTIYVNSTDMEDISMFLKLKYADCVQCIVSVLVVENL